MFILQASERRLQDSQDRMLDYERRASDHKQLISELTQKVSKTMLHVKDFEHDVSPVIELIGDNDLPLLVEIQLLFRLKCKAINLRRFEKNGARPRNTIIRAIRDTMSLKGMLLLL